MNASTLSCIDRCCTTRRGILGGLLALGSASLFGTDFPSGGDMVDAVKGLAECGFSAPELRAIERDNALRLAPRMNRQG